MTTASGLALSFEILSLLLSGTTFEGAFRVGLRKYHLPETDNIAIAHFPSPRGRALGGLIPAPAGGLHSHTSRALHERALRIKRLLIPKASAFARAV